MLTLQEGWAPAITHSIPPFQPAQEQTNSAKPKFAFIWFVSLAGKKELTGRDKIKWYYNSNYSENIFCIKVGSQDGIKVDKPKVKNLNFTV